MSKIDHYIWQKLLFLLHLQLDEGEAASVLLNDAAYNVSVIFNYQL